MSHLVERKVPSHRALGAHIRIPQRSILHDGDDGMFLADAEARPGYGRGAAARGPPLCLTGQAAERSFLIMQDTGKLILRLTVGGLILFHGINKLVHGIAWMSGPLAAIHLPFLIAYGVYVGEVVAPIFLIIGLWTRVAALVVAFNMAMAIGMEAWKLALTINRGGGWGIELEAFYLLIALAVFFLGAGGLSVSRGKGKLD